MTVQRKIGHAPKTTQLASDLYALNGPCVGCAGCQGMCAALIDAMTLPDLILSKTKA